MGSSSPIFGELSKKIIHTSSGSTRKLSTRPIALHLHCVNPRPDDFSMMDMVVNPKFLSDTKWWDLILIWWFTSWWLNQPIKSMCHQIGSFAQGSGWTWKIYETTTTTSKWWAMMVMKPMVQSIKSPSTNPRRHSPKLGWNLCFSFNICRCFGNLLWYKVGP